MRPSFPFAVLCAIVFTCAAVSGVACANELAAAPSVVVTEDSRYRVEQMNNPEAAGVWVTNKVTGETAAITSNRTGTYLAIHSKKPGKGPAIAISSQGIQVIVAGKVRILTLEKIAELSDAGEE